MRVSVYDEGIGHSSKAPVTFTLTVTKWEGHDRPKGTGPKGPFKFMMSDASDFFTDLSKKLKAMGGVPADATMTAEELAAKENIIKPTRGRRGAAKKVEEDSSAKKVKKD